MYDKVAFIGYSKHAFRIATSFKKINKKLSFIFFNYKKINFNNIYKSKNIITTSDIKTIKNCKIIVICCPPDKHFYYLKKLINKNSYFFLEKPPVTKISELNAIQNIKFKKNIYFNFNYIFSDLYKFIQKELKKKSNGKLIKINIHASHGLAYKKNIKKKYNWRFANNNTNSISGNLGIHYIHLLINLLGKPNSYSIKNFKISNNINIDTTQINLDFGNIFSEIFLSYASVKYKKIELTFDNSIIIITEDNSLKYFPRNNYDKSGKFETPKPKILIKTNLFENDGLNASVKYFLSIYKNKNISDKNQFKNAIEANQILLKYK